MLYKIINTYADESDFILNLIDDHPYIGWYMLLRLGESDTTKATVSIVFLELHMNIYF